MRRNAAQTDEEENNACKEALMKQRFAPLAKGLVLVSLIGTVAAAAVVAGLGPSCRWSGVCSGVAVVDAAAEADDEALRPVADGAAGASAEENRRFGAARTEGGACSGAVLEDAAAEVEDDDD